MQIKIQNNKTTLSTWLVFSFFLILAISSSISILFQNSQIAIHEHSRQKIFLKENLKNVTEIVLKNKLGRYNLKKEGSSWNLIHPRKLPTKQLIINEIFSNLENLTIKNKFTSDPINISHYSLNNPLMTITLITSDMDKKVIKFGLINPINNSTYIAVTPYEFIYQIKTIPSHLETLVLADFINSRIFANNISNINSLKIFRGHENSTYPLLAIKNKADKWFNSKNEPLQNDKVQTFIQSLTDIKSQIILDKTGEKIKDTLNKYLKNPLYTVAITNKLNEKTSYLISHIVQSIPGVKVEKRQHFIVKASNKEFAFLLHKQHLTLFSKRNRNFRVLNLRKIIY